MSSLLRLTLRAGLALAILTPSMAALSQEREPRDRPDLREAWMARYYGVPATAAYLDFKAKLAAREVNRYAPAFRRALVAVPQWREIGPKGGRTGFPLVSTEINDSGRSTAIVTHPTDAKIIYVAYAGGGVWKTTDGQLDAAGDWTWRSITDSLPASSGGGNIAVGAFAMHPTQPETLYLALGDAFDSPGRGFYVSTNGGDTWSQGGSLGAATRSYALLPLASGTLLVGTDQGLFRSTNGGTTFSAVALTGLTNPKVWSIVALSPTDLVCSAASGGGSLWYSADAGQSWTRGTLDAAATAKTPNRISLATSASSSALVFGTFQSGNKVAKGLLKTADKGHTWTFVDGTAAGVLSDANNQGFYNLGIAVDPDDPNKIFIGADNSVWRTLDGGTTWSRMTDAYHDRYQYAHADVHCTAWSKTGPKTLFYGTDGGFTIFRDPYLAPIPVATSGVPTPIRTFADSRRNSGISTQLIYNLGCTIASSPADSRYRIVTGHQDNGSRVRVGSGNALDASTAFDETAPTGDGFAALIHPNNGDLMLTASYNNGVMKSTTGGGEGSWAYSYTGLPGGSTFKSVLVLGLADPSGNTVYAFSNQVYKSTNFGSSWSALSMTGYAGSITHVNAAAGDANALAVVGGSTGAATYNGGTNWTTFGAFPASASANYVAFDPGNAQVIYVASTLNSASAAHLFRSQNGGQSWQALDTDSNGFPFGIPVHVVQVAPWSSSEIYAGTDFGLYRSVDSGTTWERYGQGLPLVSTRDIYLAPDRSFIRVATFGRGVWEIVPEPVGVSVTVTPGSVNLLPSATRTFTATVLGSADTSVTWSIQQGTAGGTIDGAGLYTAPSHPGSYTIVATSQADPAKSGSATVTVARSLDLNGDGVVDLRDLLVLGQRFGTPDVEADLDGNGTVDAADLTLLLAGL
ncbi:MAG TPA: dockerin type I domain-containing protein [Holophagaceae bacterium]|nr:dockerin type I domain-containing protein [Holophagaceae bacterium]